MKSSVVAFDTAGNKFTKIIQVYDGPERKKDKYGYYGKIIDFGWPVEYYINSLLRDCPFDGDLCIDAGGKNHWGHTTYIAKDDINEILKSFKED